ncbi:carboxymuconolactone decarboxylase family protein [Streptomyces althioticus]|uniref:carboxymuconolactone decarboxylase family protein n=1 Tax=Streptomyces althioticus group TaxID=2867194 RepID=UPI0033E1605C|nr:carboxymuconolactone decarboxylase family protein [Streptomyces althioticus]
MTEHPVLDDLPPGDWHHLPRARVEPAAPRSLGPTARLVLRLIRRRARVPRDYNVFRTLARLRGIFPAHAVFLSQILLKGRLPVAEKELVILRVAWRQGCVYEWSLHSPMATAAGVPEHHKRAAASEAPRFDDPRLGAMVAATDEILASGTLPDASWSALCDHCTPDEALELCMLIGHYVMIALTLNTVGVQLDRQPAQEPAG